MQYRRVAKSFVRGLTPCANAIQMAHRSNIPFQDFIHEVQLMNRHTIATTARTLPGAVALVRLVFSGGEHRPGEGAVASP
jgi:hypothetical protein